MLGGWRFLIGSLDPIIELGVGHLEVGHLEADHQSVVDHRVVGHHLGRLVRSEAQKSQPSAPFDSGQQ